jgi:hypothetical protein
MFAQSDMLLGPNGLASAGMTGVYLGNSLGGHLFFAARWAGFSDPLFLNFCFAATLCGALSLILGRGPRVAAVLLFCTLSVLQQRALFTMYGGDTLLKLFLVYIFLAPAPALSASELSKVIPGAGFRLCKLQITFIYISTALWKAASTDWWNGRAIYNALNSANYSRIADILPPDSPLLFQILGLSVMAIEFLLGILLWSKGTRWRMSAVALGVALHLGIESFMVIPFWQWTMMGALILFVPQEILVKAIAYFKPLPAPNSGPKTAAPMTPAPNIFTRAAVWCWVVLALVASPPFFGLHAKIHAQTSQAISYLAIWQDWRMFSKMSPDTIRIEAKAVLADGRIVSWHSPRFNELSYFASYRYGRFNKWIENIQLAAGPESDYWKTTANYIASEIARRENGRLIKIRVQGKVTRPKTFDDEILCDHLYRVRRRGLLVVF